MSAGCEKLRKGHPAWLLQNDAGGGGRSIEGRGASPDLAGVVERWMSDRREVAGYQNPDIGEAGRVFTYISLTPCVRSSRASAAIVALPLP